jgi:phosphatidylglycerophosphatase A
MMRDRLLAHSATLGPIGNLPAPGTMGSLLALIIGGGITITIGIESLVVLIVVATILGFPAADAHFRLTGIKDSGSVIIDEVVGQWLVLLAIPIAPALNTSYITMLVIAFVLFRFFDIFKMGPVKIAEDLPGAAGVMADDVVAGILAGLVILLGFKTLSMIT